MTSDCYVYPTIEKVVFDDYVFWTFIEFFILYNNACVVVYDPAAKKQHLLELRKVLETSVAKFREKEKVAKGDYERSIIVSRLRLSDTLKALEEQLTLIENETKSLQEHKPKNVVMEKLKLLFNHYSKLYFTNGNYNSFTFEKLKNENETMSVSEWMGFCRDFDIISKAHPVSVAVIHAGAARDVQEGSQKH